MNPEVLIVGAGPVGLTMAVELTRYGIPVRIVDKAAQRSDKSKALAIWSRTLELLDRAGCADALVSAGRKGRGANIVAGNTVLGHMNFDTVQSPFPFGLMLPQSETERVLEEHLNTLGVRVERVVELISFADVDGVVSCRLRHADGQKETLTVAWLIGCDGAHSTVRHGLGTPFEGSTLQSDWLLADIHLQGLPLPDSEVAIFLHQDGVLAVFPITPGRFRVIADLGPAAVGAAMEPTLAAVQAVIARRGPGGMVVSDPVWLSIFRINERKVGDYRSGRVFLAGDAAHVHSPAGGQGMNTGMQDAVNLAWKLALVCRQRCAEKILDSYSIERSAVGVMVLKNAGRLTRLAVMRSRGAQRLRNLLLRGALKLSFVRRAVVNAMTEVSIRYSRSPLNGPGAKGIAGPKPGERVPPGTRDTPIGGGTAPRFVLCAQPDEAATQWVARYTDLLDARIRPACDAGGMWLVRPDGYAACVAMSGRFDVLTDYLAALESAGRAR